MRIVSTHPRDAAAVQELRPAHPAHKPALRDGILRRMSMAAKARFAANKRLEAKGVATNVGLQLANLYTIAIGILLIQFPSSELLKPVTGALNYISLVASVFVTIMAMLESSKDYSGRAMRMHDCAVAISSLRQRLELDPRNDWQTIEWYRSQYELIIKDAALNHDPLDFRAAQLDPDRIMPRSREQKMAVARWRVANLWNIYGLTTCILVSPWLVMWALIRLGLG